MKQKILFLCFSVLASLGIYAQEEATPTLFSNTGSNNGTYVFSKATLAITNFDTKQEVESYTITDPATIDSTNFHFNNVFLQAVIYDGTLTECIMLNQQGYIVRGNMLIKDDKKEVTSYNDTGNGEVEQTLYLNPYQFTLADGKVTFEFLYPFGDSRYNFPLEAKLTIILTKQ